MNLNKNKTDIDVFGWRDLLDDPDGSLGFRRYMIDRLLESLVWFWQLFQI